ncbi:MAG: STAS domain-containing protein [Clostridiales bacterium]|nr:STAS domain-containing protein [Clostridiales bacterium]
MQIKSRVVNRTLYILLSGELDEYTAPTVRKNLDTLMQTQKGFIQIVMDLSELTFMDSTGVGVLIGRYKKMRESNKPIFITNPSRNAERIFKMSGLYEIMPKIV